MSGREQVKNKVSAYSKHSWSVPFGTFTASIFTTQILARLKLQREKKINFHGDQEKILNLCKKFI